MITIYKNGQKAVVPANAFKSMFQPYGWSLTPPSDKPKKGGKKEKLPPPPLKEEEDDEEEDTPEKTTEDLEKMTEPELRQYAALLGIKTKNLKSRDEVMEAIEAAQK